MRQSPPNRERPSGMAARPYTRRELIKDVATLIVGGVVTFVTIALVAREPWWLRFVVGLPAVAVAGYATEWMVRRLTRRSEMDQEAGPTEPPR